MKSELYDIIRSLRVGAFAAVLYGMMTLPFMDVSLGFAVASTIILFISVTMVGIVDALYVEMRFGLLSAVESISNE